MESTGHQLIGGQSEVGSEDEVIRFVYTKRCDEVTSSLVGVRADLISSHNLTHTDNGMASTDSESVFFLLTANTLLTGLPEEGKVRLSSCDAVVSKLLKRE